MRVGFVGLGRMGGAMCKSLAAHGHDLTLFDVDPGTTHALALATGGSEAVSVAALAGRVDAVMISVPGPAEADDVMLGAQGLLAGARPGLLVLDATTIGVPQSRRLAAEGASRGIAYLDTPVSIIRPAGGTPTLTVMAGGSVDDFARARPILTALTPQVHHLGPSGSGSAAKLLNQAIYVGYMTLFAEALAIAEAHGVALDPLLDALATSSAGIPNIVAKYDDIRGRANGRFVVDSALKYLDLTSEAFSAPVPTPMLDASAAALRDASRAGRGNEDLIAGRLRTNAARGVA